ncbi:MAG: hypothetical protein HYV28_21385, partial [Ignavibacteriales bacterium]|nr:hypothetical protein [Ignavibacteriales bacterium]
YRDRFNKDNNDKDAAIKLAEVHARKMDYDGAIEVLKKYLGNKPTDQEIDVRFALARYSAWNYQFEGAIEQMNFLLAKDPNNLEYQLFRAQVAVWTWTDPDLANKYLDNVLTDNPKNIQAIVSKATLRVREHNFPEALKLLEDGRRIKPDSKEIETAQNFYDVSLTLEEDRQIFNVLVNAREIAVTGDCNASLEKYNEWLSKTKSPGKIELLEIADVNSCAKNYNKAVEIYTQLLAEDYDYDVALLKAKATMWSGDSVSSREQFWKLLQEDSTNFDTKYYMAENYERFKDFDSARIMYDYLLTVAPDTMKRDLVMKRIGWLPVASSGDNFMGNFPVFTRLAPTFGYYSDNQNLRMINTNMLIELGLLSNFSVGVSLGRVFLTGTTINKYDIDSYFTTFKWSVFYYPLPNLYFTASTGTLSYKEFSNRRVEEFGFRYDRGKKWSIGGLYTKTDAAVVLYSATLADPFVKFDARTFKFDFMYQFSPIVKLTATLNRLYISGGTVNGLASQAKVGNMATARLSRKFMPDLHAGYEFSYAGFTPQWDNPLYKFYYSPKYFEAHSIWGEYVFDPEEDLNFTLGAKLGYVPADDFMIRELMGGVDYKIGKNFVFSGKVTIGESYRETSSYQYASGFFSIYWSF